MTMSVPRNVLWFEVLLYIDRKSTRLNSSHQIISYAVFCLKTKKTPFHLFRPAFLKIRIFLFFDLMAKRRWLASGVMRSFLLCDWIEALHCINISAGWPALPDLPARRSDTRLVGGRPDRTRRRAGQEIEQPALKVRLAWDHDRRRRWRKLRAIGDHCKRRAGYRCTGGERYPDQPEYAHSELWHVEVPVDIDGRFWRVLFPSGVQQRGLCARHLSTLARRLH